jgi:cytochrome bd-type quinol oxidase subunit 2
MTRSTPFALRAVVFAAIGVGLVSGWLQPVYEQVIVGGGVYVPRWWSFLHVASLAVLLFLSFFLRRRDRRLCIATWCAFWVSLLSNVIPGFA